MTSDKFKKIEELISQKDKTFIIFHDTETTGVSQTDRILQSAHTLYELKGDKLVFHDYVEENIMPPVEIGPMSASIHGIWYPDLEGCPVFADSETLKYFDIFIQHRVYYCAHNSDFDISQLEKEGVNYPTELVIDTLQIAKLFNKDNPKIDSNGLQYLRYYYNFDMQSDFTDFLSDYNIVKLQPHTALSDIAVLGYYFIELMKAKVFSDFDEAVVMSNTPSISPELGFQKQFPKGTPLPEIITGSYKQGTNTKRGIDYLNWAMTKMATLAPDNKLAIAHYTMEAVANEDISLTDKAITPMKAVAAAFLPEFHELLRSSGYEVERVKDKTLQMIQDNVLNIEANGLQDDRDAGYSSLKKMLKYAKVGEIADLIKRNKTKAAEG